MDTSIDEHKRLVTRFYEEMWRKGNVEVADEIFAEDYVRHDLRPSTAASGPAGQRAIAMAFRAAFPDLSMTLDLMVAEDDLVAARWTTTGTMTGRWGDVEATGNRATFSGVNIFRISGGKVVELWNHRDDLGLMEQVGAPVFAGATEKNDER